jgi:hypothetical protein
MTAANNSLGPACIVYTTMNFKVGGLSYQEARLTFACGPTVELQFLGTADGTNQFFLQLTLPTICDPITFAVPGSCPTPSYTPTVSQTPSVTPSQATASFTPSVVR